MDLHGKGAALHGESRYPTNSESHYTPHNRLLNATQSAVTHRPWSHHSPQHPHTHLRLAPAVRPAAHTHTYTHIPVHRCVDSTIARTPARRPSRPPTRSNLHSSATASRGNDGEAKRKRHGSFLEALPVHHTRPIGLVLGAADPHLLESGQGGEDGATDPDRVLALRRRDNLDLHGRRCERLNLALDT